jgi:hypothetical protein
MGVTPQGKIITIGFDCQFDVHLKDSTISSILAAFAELLPQLLADFLQRGYYCPTPRKGKISLLLTVLDRKVQSDELSKEHFSINQGYIPIFGVFRQDPDRPSVSTKVSAKAISWA